MIGVVVVTHSETLAAGVIEVASEMAPDATLVPAGGTEDGRIGTSVERISGAIETAREGTEGVVVLADLGSAVMNAEIAVEESEGGVLIADAPLVEGALNAAVSATSRNATLESVREAAEDARYIDKV